MTTLQEQLARICELQVVEQFLLTGIYLEPRDLESIRGLLAPDEPNVGAAGRLDGVPVFDKGATSLLDGSIARASAGSIDYTFIDKGVWDIGDYA